MLRRRRAALRAFFTGGGAPAGPRVLVNLPDLPGGSQAFPSHVHLGNLMHTGS